MPAKKRKRGNINKVRGYLEGKKNSILEEISVLSYVTKPKLAGDQVDPRVVAYSDPNSHITEQYRALRTNIISLSPENPVRTFLVTSALRGEGKTISACNLGLIFSKEMEKKVILIDGDMRKSSIHRIFGLNKSPGLSEILSGQAIEDDFFHRPTVENLYVIPSGAPPANPAELLGSVKMKELVVKLRENFDWIIFDVAPILAVTDAGVLGKLLDGSIMVVKAGKTQAVDVERAYSLLLEANANPIGSILTSVVTYIPYYLYRYRYMYSTHYHGA